MNAHQRRKARRASARATSSLTKAMNELWHKIRLAPRSEFIDPGALIKPETRKFLGLA